MKPGSRRIHGLTPSQRRRRRGKKPEGEVSQKKSAESRGIFLVVGWAFEVGWADGHRAQHGRRVHHSRFLMVGLISLGPPSSFLWFALAESGAGSNLANEPSCTGTNA